MGPPGRGLLGRLLALPLLDLLARLLELTLQLRNASSPETEGGLELLTTRERGLELGLQFGNPGRRCRRHARDLCLVRLRLARPRLHLGLELGDTGRRRRGDARDLGSIRLRGFAQPGLQLVHALSECVSLADNRAEHGLEFLDARRKVGWLRSGAGEPNGLRNRAQARADPELGLEQAAVLLGEGVLDRPCGDEAQLDEDRPERPPGPALLGERVGQLLAGQEPFVDHELA